MKVCISSQEVTTVRRRVGWLAVSGLEGGKSLPFSRMARSTAECLDAPHGLDSECGAQRL